MTIRQLEKEIFELRQHLIYDQNKLNELENELNILKIGSQNNVSHYEMQSQQESYKQNTSPQLIQQPIQSTLQQIQIPMQQAEKTKTIDYKQQNINRNSISRQNEKSFDIEKFIGKSWMGIMASVLIFISIIMFAVILLPHITDAMKMVIMYAVSFAFMGCGLYLHKKFNNTFYMILSVCGMGALYISVLMGNIYFNAFGDMLMYVFLFAWGSGIAIISKNNVTLFNIVGNIGVTISVILGTAKCVSTDDSVKFIILMLFFILSALIYILFNSKFQIINVSFNIINIASLILGFWSIDNSNIIIAIILMCVCFAQFYYTLRYKLKPESLFNVIHKILVYSIFMILITSNKSTIDIIFSEGSRYNMCSLDIILYLPIYAISIASIYLMFKFKNQIDKVDMIIIQIFDTLMIIMAAININDELFVILSCTPLLIFAFIEKDDKFFIISMILSLYQFCLSENFINGLIILSINALIIYYYQFNDDNTQKFDIIKAIASLIFRCGICFIISALTPTYDMVYNTYIIEPNYDIWHIMPIPIIFAFDLLMKYKFTNNLKNKFTLYATYLSSIILSINTINLLYDVENWCYYLLLVIGCGVFMNNTYRFIRSNESWKQIYATIKITIYLIVVLNSLSAASIVLSVVLFIAAIAWILLGFTWNIKTIRLYGLVMAIISVCKLLLIDIIYDSSLSRAIGFFVCGILSFFISFIYQHFEKAQNNIVNNKTTSDDES